MPHETLNGISRSEMLRLHTTPLWALDGFSFSGGEVVATGLALAPDGNPADVKIEAGSGISFTIDYPLPNPNAGEVYWYWKNSDKSAYRIRINLSQTTHAGKFYEFAFRCPGRNYDAAERLRTTLLIPTNLKLLQNYPEQDAMARVQFHDTISSVACRGLGDAYRVIKFAEAHGFNPRAGKVLDWGVGHGRVIRFLPDVGPLMPPMPFASDMFTLVYGISVMTHLTRTVQEAWLDEIKRVLCPGGLALLTFAGDSSVAFASRFLDRKWLDEYLAKGTGPDLKDRSLVGVIENHEYYKNVKLSLAEANKLCRQYLNVVAAYECAFGYQDLIVLRK
jgi:hypothetical protein